MSVLRQTDCLKWRRFLPVAITPSRAFSVLRPPWMRGGRFKISDIVFAFFEKDVF
jgi:hypothetical protein